MTGYRKKPHYSVCATCIRTNRCRHYANDKQRCNQYKEA